MKKSHRAITTAGSITLALALLLTPHTTTEQATQLQASLAPEATTANITPLFTPAILSIITATLITAFILSLLYRQHHPKHPHFYHHPIPRLKK